MMNRLNNESWRDWYSSLSKPEWTPNASTISAIWTLLYPIIFVTYAYVFAKVIKKKYPKHVAVPFFLNLIFNFAFTPIFFGLKNIPFATIDILAVWVTIVWSAVAIWRYSKWTAILQIPYLVWVSITSILQIWIAIYN